MQRPGQTHAETLQQNKRLALHYTGHILWHGCRKFTMHAQLTEIQRHAPEKKLNNKLHIIQYHGQGRTNETEHRENIANI